MTRLAGWGRYPVVESVERVSEDLERITRDAALTRGLGRSYGDASLPPGGRDVACSRLADRVIAFDPATGVLRAEAGFSLRRLNGTFLPRGWSSPVSPGTQFVTLGGMVASDVHGKNHHVAGCFGEHVRALRIRVADERILEIDDEREPELFRATLGGMGLTGHILEVEVQLVRISSSWIIEETEPVENLDELVQRLREASRTWPFTVSWVDSLARGSAMGRGIVIKGRWAEPTEAPARAPKFSERAAIPFDLPGWMLNAWTVRAFNTVYYRLGVMRRGRRVAHPQPFFYPLDSIRDWNRLYGRRGFTQYQCVLPDEQRHETLRRFFDTLTRARGASFLSVVKDCGAQGKGLISFPMPGISVALDLPMRGGRTQDLVNALNEIVVAAGGRIYLTKDALTRAEDFRAMEPRLESWNAVRRRWDPEARLASALSVRLFGDPR